MAVEQLNDTCSYSQIKALAHMRAHTSRSQPDQNHGEQSEVVRDTDANGAVVDPNVQQGNEEE